MTLETVLRERIEAALVNWKARVFLPMNEAETRTILAALSEVEKLRGALAFYADPETYHACGFRFDRPTGGFDEDFSEDHGHEDYDRPMPGKLARQALGDT